MDLTNKNEIRGLMVERSPEFSHAWSEFFAKKATIELVLMSALPDDLRPFLPVSFFLLDEEAVLSASQATLEIMRQQAVPIFAISDYITIPFMDRCLELGVTGCFDHQQPLESVTNKILQAIRTDRNVEGWQSWEVLQEHYQITHPSQLPDDETLKGAFILCFIKHEAIIVEVAREMGVNRITARKYYERFQRAIFAFFAKSLCAPQAKTAQEVSRQVILRAMKRKWLYKDFCNLRQIYGPSHEDVLSRVLDIPLAQVVQFINTWDDLWRIGS